jgi:hypothetical protein
LGPRVGLDGFDHLFPIGVELQTIQATASSCIDYPTSAHAFSLGIYKNNEKLEENLLIF